MIKTIRTKFFYKKVSKKVEMNILYQPICWSFGIMINLRFLESGWEVNMSFGPLHFNLWEISGCD